MLILMSSAWNEPSKANLFYGCCCAVECLNDDHIRCIVMGHDLLSRIYLLSKDIYVKYFDYFW